MTRSTPPTMPRVSLAGKTALVTGAARRVGRAIAEELGRSGARVVLHHHASPHEAEELRTQLPGAAVVAGDLRRPEVAALLVQEACRQVGQIDFVVNNAADFQRTPFSALSDEIWGSMMALNLDGPMRLIREARSAGLSAVVNIVDVAAMVPWPHFAAYSTSKSALLHLSRCLALELAPAVRVNAVAPGTVAFPPDWDEAQRTRQIRRIPLGRIGEPEDVARAVRFLFEEEFLTGVCLPVDGGASLR